MNFYKVHLWWYKKTHWEYWHTRTIYVPLFWAWLYLAIKNRSLYFFNYGNPSFKFGGFAMCSKKEIYDLIPAQWIPKTIKIIAGSTYETTCSELKKNTFKFPIVLKPDIGLKGLGVKFIADDAELFTAISNISQDHLLQEKIPYTNEVGIFYIRYPDQQNGSCTGMVHKDFLKVVGDGCSSLGQLIMNDTRAFVHYEKLYTLWNVQWNDIIEKDKIFTLVPVGSHTLGATFYDVSDSLTPELCKQIDSICTQIEGFYYGRLDIMYKDWDRLLAGMDFKIIELNGAAAEPTHMYDPKHSYFNAAKIVIQHWKFLSDISLKNKRGYKKTPSVKETTKALIQNVSLERQLRRIQGL